MRVYLARHGEAASSDQNQQRPLTHSGREETRKVAEFLRKQCLRVRAIEHSGKLRAQETADILGSTVGSDEGVARTDGLAPNDEVGRWVKDLSEAEEDIMLVGHLPFMGRLASALLTGSQQQDVVNFKPSSLLCLERTDEGKWQFIFFI